MWKFHSVERDASLRTEVQARNLKNALERCMRAASILGANWNKREVEIASLGERFNLLARCFYRCFGKIIGHNYGRTETLVSISVSNGNPIICIFSTPHRSALFDFFNRTLLQKSNGFPNNCELTDIPRLSILNRYFKVKEKLSYVFTLATLYFISLFYFIVLVSLS